MKSTDMIDFKKLRENRLSVLVFMFYFYKKNNTKLMDVCWS